MDLINTFEGYPISQVFLDPSAASFHVELKRNKMPVRQADNDVLPGIRFVSTLLSQGNLVICNQCTNLIKSIESYTWSENAAKRGKDEPNKVNDHACDALRYVVYSKFGKKQSLKEETREDRHQRAYQANPAAFPGFSANDFGWQR